MRFGWRATKQQKKKDSEMNMIEWKSINHFTQLSNEVSNAFYLQISVEMMIYSYQNNI